MNSNTNTSEINSTWWISATSRSIGNGGDDDGRLEDDQGKGLERVICGEGIDILDSVSVICLC
jgi:hypothetical protein